jgi:hypothetical protein
MARKPMTEAQKKARAKKAAATRAAKQKAALELLGAPERKKVRKKRTMTAAQKKAAAERLAKARAARGPAKHSQYAAEVVALPDDATFSLKRVRGWIKSNKAMLASIRSFRDSKDAKEREQYAHVEAYLANLNSYLRTGVWTDLFYGENGATPVKFRCVAMAYNKDGTPKRSEGVFYPDIGCVYTKEMASEENARKTISNKGKVRKAR